MSTNRIPLLALALVAALGLSFAACSGDDPDDKDKTGQGGDGAGGDLGPVEICDNGIDDDEDELVDCEDPDCETHEACDNGSCKQCQDQAGCSQGLVCASEVCEPQGRVDPQGNFLTGAIMVNASLEKLIEGFPQRNRAYSVELYYPVRPNGEPLDCKALLKAGRVSSTIPDVNRVKRTTASIETGTLLNRLLASGSPVPADGIGYLALVRYYSVQGLDGAPAGELTAIGCTENVVVVEGAFVDDEDHAVDVSMGPVCRPSDPTSCPDERTCSQAFLCKNLNCGSDCGAAYNTVCRRIDGEDVCVEDCDPNRLEINGCESGEICDTTPGELPACIPLSD
jgi:hypothetical protein